jgi:hypothetical protein
MQPHNHACYYCQVPVEIACECSNPARAVLCDSCSIVYEPPPENSEAGSGE